MAPTLGGGTQVTDFDKGFTKGIFTKDLRRRNGGCEGDPDPLIISTFLGSYIVKLSAARVPSDVKCSLVFLCLSLVSIGS